MSYCRKNLHCTILFIFSLILNICSQAPGQQATCSISGTIMLPNGKPAAFATVQLLAGNMAERTDSTGYFQLKVACGKAYTLRVSYVGFEERLVPAEAAATGSTPLKITLVPVSNELAEVRVYGKSETQQVKEQTIKAEVINTKISQAQSATVVELMNRSAGIRIRQSGGLGSGINIMLNGFQGRSIKTFKDGIPTDYLGASFGLGTIPVNMLERVEVYKGVLPTSLGADALGGAVNMVSRKDGQKFAAISYEAASFNTHRASVNLHYGGDRYFAGLDAFYNYSDNNYHVTANVPDPVTANIIPTRVRLFHNNFRQLYGEIYGGVKGVPWADELRIAVTAFDIARENQFASLMATPYGASYSTQHARAIPSLRYKKSFARERIRLDQFLVYSAIRSLQADTLAGSYDWFGNFNEAVNPNQRGEGNAPTLAQIDFTNLTSRTGIDFTLNKQHTLALGVVFNDYSRSGRDPYGSVSPGSNPVDLLSLPADYTKTVATLGLASRLLKERLENVFQVKFYASHAVGQEVNTSTGLLREETSTGSNRNFGVAEAIKYNLGDHSYFRISGELATRLPEQQEILGNGAFALSNFSIKPEKSVNGNVGFHTGRPGQYSVELNGFYRITRDMIISVPVGLQYSQSINVEQIRGIGLETDLTVFARPWLALNGNFTYQDFRLYNIREYTIRYLEGARLRNMPYFFANLGVNADLGRATSGKLGIRAFWYLSYVHEYYLDYIPRDTEPDGFLGLWGKARINAPNIIPGQTINSAGIVWHPRFLERFSVAAECKNIFDKAIYDNFRVQNAGRSFHIKLNYIWKQKQNQ